MRGKWASFDPVTTNTELATIPQPDRGWLFFAMDRYGAGVDAGWVVKNYGDGLYMLKAKGQRAGRCLFFTQDEKEPTQLVALLFYKKESDDAPDHLVRSARDRRRRYLESR